MNESPSKTASQFRVRREHISMMTSSMSTRINDILDTVWQSKYSRWEEAKKVCETIDVTTASVFAAINLCDIMTIQPTAIKSTFDGCIVQASEFGETRIVIKSPGTVKNDTCYFEYIDIHRFFLIERSAWELKSPVIRYNLATFLAEMQFARDHTDSIIYLPADMRYDRLTVAANDFGVTVEQFIYLASHVRALINKVH